MTEHVFLVYEIDGTSATGVKKMIAATLDRSLADRLAAQVRERNSWNEGSVRAVPLVTA